MSEENEIVIVPESEIMLGAIPTKPTDIVRRASEIATELAKIVNTKKLFTVIGGKKYVQVEGWNTLGAMLGVLPIEREVNKIDNGYEAAVDLIRTSDGMKVGGASAICTVDERNWGSRDEYAVRSMATTRATGKAFRLGFSWIMQLAGYEVTPAEEIPHVIEHEPKPPVVERPYSPAFLKSKIADSTRAFGSSIASGSQKGATENDRKVLASALGKLVSDDTERYILTKYLTGTASTKEMDAASVFSLLRWLGNGKVASVDFNWSPSAETKAEARAAHDEALKEQGQMELPK